MNKIFEGPVVPTIIKLAVLSFVVGIVLWASGIDPLDLWLNLGDTIRNIWTVTIEFFRWAGKYMILGAIVVVPIWLVLRVLKVVSRRRAPPSESH